MIKTITNPTNKYKNNKDLFDSTDDENFIKSALNDK